MDYQNAIDNFKFDTVEKVTDFFAYASSIPREEMHVHQMYGGMKAKIDFQCNDLKETSDLFRNMKATSYKKYMNTVFDAARDYHQDEFFHILSLAELEVSDAYFSVDNNWDEFFAFWPYLSVITDMNIRDALEKLTVGSKSVFI